MSATTVSPHGRRHPIGVVVQARRYYDAGWTRPEIVRLFADDGIVVSLRSVLRWTNDRVAERDREQEAARRRRRSAQCSGRLPLSLGDRLTPEFKLARMHSLRATGMSYASIALVMNFDFGENLAEHEARYAIMHDRLPKAWR